MTQSNFYSSHRRVPSSSNPKGSTGRSSRPILHRRGTPISISKLGSGQVRRDKVDTQPCEMAASFLNFCAMCERQITVPDNSLLYCSESCRRKDSCKPLSASSSRSSLSPPTTPESTPPTSPPTIVAPMTPTRAPSPLLQMRNDPKPDLDPVLLPPPSTTSLSDAFQYLTTLHNDEIMLPGTAKRHSSTSLSTMSVTVPPLAHSQSTMASSFSSNASASDLMNSTHDPASRPLPPRHNPSFSGSPGTKSVDLVVPHVEPPMDVSGCDDSSSDEEDSGAIFPASSSVWGENH